MQHTTKVNRSDRQWAVIHNPSLPLWCAIAMLCRWPVPNCQNTLKNEGLFVAAKIQFTITVCTPTKTFISKS